MEREESCDLKECFLSSELFELRRYYSGLRNVFDSLDLVQIERVLKVLKDCKSRGNVVYIIGNGGSASTAEHYVNDFMKIGGMKSIALTNLSVITALGNDIDYEDIFVEQLKLLMNSGDVVMGISGSGNSMNVVKALEYALDNSGVAVGILGFDGGKCLSVLGSGNYVLVESKDYGYIEDVHLTLGHCLSRLLRDKVRLEERRGLDKGVGFENEIAEGNYSYLEVSGEGLVEGVERVERVERFEEAEGVEKSIPSRGFGSWS